MYLQNLAVYFLELLFMFIKIVFIFSTEEKKRERERIYRISIYIRNCYILYIHTYTYSLTAILYRVLIFQQRD